MERIWAPWRIQYIEGAKPATCVFCDVRSGGDDEFQVLARGPLTFTIMNKFPYTNGHMMVVPWRHVAKLPELTDDERLEIMQGATVATEVLAEAMHPDGFNLGMNLGKPAGAGIDAHLHMHIVPRWNGDTNFMTVLGDMRVISEALDATYRKIRSIYIARGLADGM